MSFDLDSNFGEAGSGVTTPHDPSLKSVLEHSGFGLDAALLNQADLSGSTSSLGGVTASGVAASGDLTVTGIATEDTLLSVLILVDGDGGSVTDIKSLELEKAEITGADTVVLDEDTSGDLVLVSYIDAS